MYNMEYHIQRAELCKREKGFYSVNGIGDAGF